MCDQAWEVAAEEGAAEQLASMGPRIPKLPSYHRELSGGGVDAGLGFSEPPAALATVNAHNVAQQDPSTATTSSLRVEELEKGAASGVPAQVRCIWGRACASGWVG